MPRSVMKFACLMATATMVKDQEFEELKARKYAIRINRLTVGIRQRGKMFVGI